MSASRIVTVASGGGACSQALRDLLGRVAALGWFGDAVGRVVLQPGAAGRTGLTAATIEVLAAALRERIPALEIEVFEQAEVDAVAVLGLGGAIVRVPRRWFEPYFLITVAAVHSDRRWRIGGALQAQAETLTRLNPELPAATVLSEAHRLNAADLSVVRGTHPTAGEWWAASQSAVQLDGALARAAGLDPRELPAIREIARHEVLELWDTEAAVPDLTNLAAGATGAALDATRERATAAARRAVEDAGRVSRNLRKVPQALRRRLAARAGGRKSA